MTFEENLSFVEGIGCYSPEFFTGKVEGGYHLQQNPNEMAKLLTYLQLHGPFKSYLEIGSASGGFIRCIHEKVGFESGVMIDDGQCQPSKQLENIEAFKDKISRNILDSHSDETKKVLGATIFDLIFVDGDHSYEGVAQDIDLVMPHADQDTIIVFHDIDCREVPGVKKAYEEALTSGKLVEVARFVEPLARMTFGIGVTKLP